MDASGRLRRGQAPNAAGWRGTDLALGAGSPQDTEGTCGRDTSVNSEKDREPDPQVSVSSEPERLIESPEGQFVNNCGDPAGEGRPATALTPSASHPPIELRTSASDLH